MPNQEANTDVKRDEYGLVIPVHRGMVLFVVPPRDFAEATLRHARSCLLTVDLGSRTVSTPDADLVHGLRQDEFQPDGLLREAKMDAYAGVVFCGGPGALSLVDDADVLRLTREAVAQGKTIAAWGHSTALIARTYIVRGRRVTGHPSQREALALAGAVFTGAPVEVDGTLVTGIDDTAGYRFGRALARLVQP
ncbi:MAG: DJ-1/PfpI family protein [Planctomycetota bacterium]